MVYIAYIIFSNIIDMIAVMDQSFTDRKFVHDTHKKNQWVYYTTATKERVFII